MYRVVKVEDFLGSKFFIQKKGWIFWKDVDGFHYPDGSYSPVTGAKNLEEAVNLISLIKDLEKKCSPKVVYNS